LAGPQVKITEEVPSVVVLANTRLMSALVLMIVAREISAGAWKLVD
jgi:hypothetical protein